MSTPTGGKSQSGLTYKLHFCSPELLRNESTKVSKSMQGTYTDLVKKLLTKKVREAYKTIAFDLLIGLPGQTCETMAKTCDQIIELKPTLIQLSLMAYKPWVAKYQIKIFHYV